MATPASSSVIIATLNELLDVELASAFQFLGDGGIYFDHASATLRRPIAEMIASSHRRVDQLLELIDSLGGAAIARGLQMEEQNLAYLSVQFLLPGLIGAKEVAVGRWEAAIEGIGTAVPKVKAVLEGQLAEHRKQLEILRARGSRQS
jgi:hypothetical protein